jgi:hypothetical protein
MSEHPLSIHTRWVAAGLVSIVGVGVLWLMAGNRLWSQPAPYVLIATATACIGYGLWRWSK